MKTILKIFGVALVLFAILLIIAPTVAWSGGTSMRLKFTVIDDDTARPIPSAEVIFLRPIDQEILNLLKPVERERDIKQLEGYAVTDRLGTCEITRMVAAGGSKFLFMRTGHLYIEGPITIRAEGYIQAEGLIQNLLGNKRFSIGDNHHDITIYLKKK